MMKQTRDKTKKNKQTNKQTNKHIPKKTKKQAKQINKNKDKKKQKQKQKQKNKKQNKTKQNTHWHFKNRLFCYTGYPKSLKLVLKFHFSRNSVLVSLGRTDSRIILILKSTPFTISRHDNTSNNIIDYSHIVLIIAIWPGGRIRRPEHSTVEHGSCDESV